MNPRRMWLLIAIINIVVVKAQWIQDGRCRRRRVLGSHELRESTLPGTHNVTADEQQNYWYNRYSGLRGRVAPHGRATTTSNRNLLEEDPTSFMMRMHWQEGNCWQDEWIERVYCMACEDGDDCDEGSKLWTEFCTNSPGQKFVWVPNLSQFSQEYNVGSDDVNYGQLKLAYFDLCLERMTTNTFQLQKCDANSAYQVLVGWHPTESFELHPIEHTLKCINQHHHPRPEEEIGLTFCDTARQFHTNLWKVYQNDNAANEIVRLRRRDCSKDEPCGKCEGDCDTSEDCNDDLVCAQRTPADGLMPVPGCTGIPNSNADYCAAPEDLFAPPIPNHGLRLREPACNPSNPCGQCEGDCDSDTACQGKMKCYLRGQGNADDGVPNCVGEGVPEADYCYEPDDRLSAQAAPLQLEIRRIECGWKGKVCMQCQGDCDSDEDCFGPLRCLQRGEANPFKPVPGCEGDGVDDVDYCYLPEGFSFPTPTPAPTQKENVVVIDQSEQQGNQIRLSDEIGTCSENEPCGLCAGDCDGDVGCEGSLVCHQRAWHQPYMKVPGCLGRGVPGADYCVEP